MMIEIWDSEADMGYTQLTTAFNDFSIAEKFGINAIKDTFKNLVDYCTTDYKYLTELEIVTNKKCWKKYFDGEEELSALYSEMYYKVRDMFYEMFGEDEEKSNYHFELTD